MTLKVTWYSHASFLIETKKARLLIDPFITGNPFSPVNANEVQTYYILISHGHADHVGDSVAIAKRTGAMVISNYYDTFEVIKQDPEAWAMQVQKETAAKVTVMAPGDSLEL